MHKSPDRSQDVSRDVPTAADGHRAPRRNDHLFRADLASAEALDAADEAPRDPELAADWAVKRDLAALRAAELPSGVVDRARRQAMVRPRTPWFMATAAALVAAVVATLALRAPESSPSVVTPSAREMAQLELALETLNATGRRAAAIAGRELSGSLVVPDLGLSDLPYAEYVQPYLQRRDPS